MISHQLFVQVDMSSVCISSVHCLGTAARAELRASWLSVQLGGGRQSVHVVRDGRTRLYAGNPSGVRVPGSAKGRCGGFECSVGCVWELEVVLARER